VSWFRREPAHVTLGRALNPTEDRRAPWNSVGVHGLQRPREWDEVRTVEADVRGDRAEFVVLEDAIVIEEGPDNVAPLADAISLNPPFRAEAVRRGDRMWAVAARRIEIARIEGVDSDEFEESEGHAVRRGWRLDGDLFEVRTDPL
jgi:hypothetical protein